MAHLYEYPFLTLELLAEKLTTSADNLFSASSNESLVLDFFSLSAYAGPPCEENIDYQHRSWCSWCKANDGYKDRLPSLSSCKFHCKNNYPNAPYFTWISPASNWTDGHHACYCKKQMGMRKVVAGLTSGRVECGNV